MYFGCNQNQVGSTLPAIHYPAGHTMLRTYKGISTSTRTWPAMPIAGAARCWSIRPDPAGLFAGAYDAALTAIAQAAQPGDVLSAYHEAQLAGISLATDVKVQQYIHAKIHEVTDTLPFGNITLPGASADWDAPGLDWYAIDVYDFNGSHNPAQPLNFWYDRKNSKGVAVRQSAPTLVTETNERKQFIADRPQWFAEVYAWLASPPAGMALLQFWNPGGQWSGPFENSDSATITELNKIALACTTV